MRQYLLLLLALFVVNTVSLSDAQTAPVASKALPQREHTAVITFNEAVLKTNEAQKAFADLQARFAPREAQLKTLSAEIDGLKKQLTTDGDTLNDQERATREQTIETKEKQLQREAEDYRNDSQAESQQLFEGIAQKVYAFLGQYSAQHGYSLVIERGSAESPIVWYAASFEDITGDVADAYNLQSSVASPTSGLPASRPQAR